MHESWSEILLWTVDDEIRYFFCLTWICLSYKFHTLNICYWLRIFIPFFSSFARVLNFISWISIWTLRHQSKCIDLKVAHSNLNNVLNFSMERSMRSYFKLHQKNLFVNSRRRTKKSRKFLFVFEFPTRKFFRFFYTFFSSPVSVASSGHLKSEIFSSFF